MKKRALICGISGQDGSYLANFLLNKGYKVFGTSRDAKISSFSNLQKLECKKKISFLSMTPDDFISVLVTFQKVQADEIYFLAGQSSVGLSFEQPAETIKGILLGTLNALEAVKMLKKPTRIYFAGSSESFGDTNGEPMNEKTLFKPKSHTQWLRLPLLCWLIITVKHMDCLRAQVFCSITSRFCALSIL